MKCDIQIQNKKSVQFKVKKRENRNIYSKVATEDEKKGLEQQSYLF